MDGLPTLIVEILSPYDQHQDVHDRLESYLRLGVPLVWIVDPDAKSVMAYRPGDVPKLYTVNDEIDAEPHLPSFRAPVQKFFLRG